MYNTNCNLEKRNKVTNGSFGYIIFMAIFFLFYTVKDIVTIDVSFGGKKKFVEPHKAFGWKILE